MPFDQVAVPVVETPPVETVVETPPVETVTPPVEESPVEETPTEEVVEEEHKKKSGLDKRFAKLTKEKAALAQEAEYWRTEALKQHQPAAAQPAPTSPKLEDFNNDFNAYADAVIEHKLATKTQVQQQSAVLQTYNQRVAEFQKSTPDFQEVLDSAADVQAAPEIHQALLDSEYGPQMAYYLANNTEEVDRINSLPPHRRLIEMGKIEDKLSAPKPVVVKTTKPAPEPIKPVSGPTSVVEKSIYEMTPQELMAYRNKKSRR